MKKRAAAFALMSILMISMCSFAFASENTQKADELLSQSIDGMHSQLPQSVDDWLWGRDTNQLTDAGGMIGEVVGQALDEFSDKSRLAVRLVGIMLALTLLSSLANEVFAASGFAFAVRLCFAAAATVASGGVIIELLEWALECFKRSQSFILAFAPIYAGLIVSSGSAATGALGSSLLIGCQNAAVALVNRYVQPICAAMLGLSAAAGIGDTGLLGLVNGLKKLSVWSIGIISTLFSGFVRLQSALTLSADTVGIRTARFFASGAFPAVGAAFTEAVSALRANMSLVKNAVGLIGIASELAFFLPLIFCCVTASLGLGFTSIVGEMLEQRESACFLRGIKAAVDVICMVGVLNMSCVIVATLILLNTAQGV